MAWLSAATLLFSMAVSTFPTPLYPHYEQEFQLDTLGVTIIFSCFAAGAVGSLAVLRRSTASVRAHHLIVGAGVLAALAAVLLGTTHSLAIFVVARVVSGAAAGSAAAVATARILRLARQLPESHARILKAATPGFALAGLAMGPLLSGVLCGLVGTPRWLAYLLVAACTCLAAVLLAILGFRDPDPPQTIAGHAIWSPPAFRDRLGALLSFATTGVFGALTPTMLAAILGSPPVWLAGLLAALPFAAASLAARSKVGSRLISGGLVVGGLVLANLSVAFGLLGLLAASGIIAGCGAGFLLRDSLASAFSSTQDPRRTSATMFMWAYLGLVVPIIGLGLASRIFALTTGLGGLIVLAFVGVSVPLAIDAAARRRSTKGATTTPE